MKKFKKFAALAIIAILALAVCGAVLAEPVPTTGGMPAPVDNTPKGYIWTAVGISIAMILPGIGSALGVGMAGRAAAGVAAEDPEKSGACLMFELLPATQGLYGFIIAIFLAFNSGLIRGELMSLPTNLGLSYFYSALPIGVVGLVSAYFQSRVCCAGIGIVAKQGNGGMGITFAIMVELYAILALIISILMVVGVPRVA